MSRKADEERARRLASIVVPLGVANEAASAFGGTLANAFSKGISGQQDFGKALEEGSKATLQQLGTKFVAEGIGALLQAVGFAATGNPAAAGKAAEGGGLVALGLSLGAASGAINTGAPAAEKPDSPPQSGARNGGNTGGGNVVVNWNAPTVTASTSADVGREIARTIRSSESRFGRAA
jgi:hypothetical protein